MPIPISELRQLIAQGKLEEVIAQLMESSAQLPEGLREEVYSLSSRWQRLQQKIRQGLLTDGEQEVEVRKTEKAILGLLNVLEKGEEKPPVIPVYTPPTSTSPWKRYAAIAVTVIAVLAGIAEITGINLMGLLNKEEPTTADKADTPQEDTIAVPSLPEPTGPGLPADDPPAESPTRTVESSPSMDVSDSEKGGRPDSSTLPAVQDKLELQTQTNKGPGAASFTSTETMRVYYKVNRPCLLRVIYKLADDRLILFEDDRKVTEEQVGKFVELGDGYEAAAPFGQEQMYFFAQSEPFPPLETQMAPDGYLEITEGLQKSLRKTRGFKKKVYQVESVLPIRTQE
ncbi:MAG: hypothetical protein AAFP77_14425 [Bacteroidota bacterium]